MIRRAAAGVSVALLLAACSGHTEVRAVAATGAPSPSTATASARPTETRAAAPNPLPAAGDCATAKGALAVVEVTPDLPLPRCQVVKGTQRLKVVNTTGRYGEPAVTVTVTFADYPPRRLAAGASTTFQRTFAQLLRPGVHVVHISLYDGDGAQLWFKG